MDMNDLVIVSVDDHIIEPPDMWDNHLSAQHKAIAPRMVRDATADYWIFEGKRVSQGATNAVVGRPREEYGFEPTGLDQMRRGTWDIDAHIDDMNVNGILASINFPSIISFDGSLFLKYENKADARILVSAYNDWHIDEWCGKYPGRSIPTAVVPMWDVAACVAEIERVARKGCHSLAFSENPTAKGLPSIHDSHWEPFWKACADNRMALNLHIGTGFLPAHASPLTPIDAWITSFPMTIAAAAADWLHLDALNRYPLKISLSEGGIGWVPYFLERAEYTHVHHSAWTHASFGSRTPTQTFRDHFLTCFVEDKFGLKNLEEIGEKIVAYECDYPHSDTQWPQVPENFMKTVAGLTDEQIDRVSHLNALEFFDYDAIGIMGGRANCTVGALRAKATHVDVGEVPLEGVAPVQKGTTRRVTSGDVIAMQAKLFAHDEMAADA